MWHGRRAKAAKSCAHAVGVGNVIMLVLAKPGALILSLAVVLAPFTLAMALRLTAALALGVLSLALIARRDRAELLVCAIGAMQPPSAGEEYRETMIADIRDDELTDEILRKIPANLLKTAPRTILAAWVRIPRLLWKRATRR
jgi:hypothetical protein